MSSDRQIEEKCRRINELKDQRESVEKSIEPLLKFFQEISDKIYQLGLEIDRDMGYSRGATPAKSIVAATMTLY